jgi:predicted Fe-Mo cluster-binding NifX family protein
MLLAVPTYNDRVAPTFDFCHRVSFWRVEGQETRKIADRKCTADSIGEKAAHLQAMGTELLLCGAVSSGLLQDLNARGIKVLSGLAGDVAEVVSAFACGSLNNARFQLPGADSKPIRIGGGP